jgi:lactoylglutathione lyase
MTTVDRPFEAHLRDDDLDVSLFFYRDILGFEVAHVTPDRRAAFLWIDRRGQTMLGLWAGGTGPVPDGPSHLAFATSVESVLAAPGVLRTAGIVPLDFDGQPTDEPVVLGWMPAAAVYLRDPSGHLLEYIAMLDEAARPEAGVVDWSTWAQASNARSEPDQAGTRHRDGRRGSAARIGVTRATSVGAYATGGRTPSAHIQPRDRSVSTVTWSKPAACSAARCSSSERYIARSMSRIAGQYSQSIRRPL